MKMKFIIYFIAAMILTISSTAIEIQGYQQRHTEGVTQLVLSSQDIIVNGRQYDGYAWSNGKIQIDTKKICTYDYNNADCVYQVQNEDDIIKFKQILNHESSHIYCNRQGWGFEHNACFRDRNRILGQIYGVQQI